MTYYFLCECAKCLEPEIRGEIDGAACPNKDCDHFVDVECGKCDKCGTVADEGFISEFKEVLQMTEEHLQSMKQISCKV